MVYQTGGKKLYHLPTLSGQWPGIRHCVIGYNLWSFFVPRVRNEVHGEDLSEIADMLCLMRTRVRYKVRD